MSNCYCLLAVLLLACAAICGCKPQEARRPVAVIVSGDTSGWIVPCGCTSNQSGGLPRRAAYIEQLRQTTEVIPLDVGGAAHGTSPYDVAKFKAILHGEALMQTVAHNLGESEARLGAAKIREIAKEMNVPFVSANVRDAEGRLLAEPMRILTASGHRIAVVGVLSQHCKSLPGDIRVSPPREAVLNALHAMTEKTEKYDSVIVLAYMPEDELRRFTESLPEVDVVAGGPTFQPIAPKRIGPTLLTSATSKGKFVARLDSPATPTDGSLDEGSQGEYLHGEYWHGEIVELDGRFTDHPQQVTNVASFRAGLGQSDFAPRDTSFVAAFTKMPKDFTIAGVDACRKCHEDDCRLWHSSKHASAWQSLKDKQAEADPDCQRCHVTGYGLPDGFASLKDARPARNRINVGCECCHGPSQQHVADSKQHTTHYAQAKNQCLDCHDRENSPKFDQDAYWKKILHGQEKGKDVP